MPRLTLLVSVAAALVLTILPERALAQQDTTPPAILGFTISPTAFDTGPGPVVLTACVTARDDLSGLRLFQVLLASGLNGPVDFNWGGSFANGLEETACSQFSVPRFSAYSSEFIGVSIADNANNFASAYFPGLFNADPLVVPDLCQLGPCEVTNRPGSALPDSDGDGVPDDADNCPTIVNPEQGDTDRDLIGDACDPYPNNRDNDQAQCDADLAQCIDSQTSCPADLTQAQQDLATCEVTLASTQTTLTNTQTSLSTCESNLVGVETQLTSETADSDGDGVRDLDDDCPDTPSSTAVDRQGCSQAQFCGAISVLDSTGRKLCLRADWKNDEPLMKTRERDCAIDRNLPGPADDRCVAAL